MENCKTTAAAMAEQAFYKARSGFLFRPGERAKIRGVYVVSPPGCHPRPCLEVEFIDGVKDYVPLSLAEHFEILPAASEQRYGEDGPTSATLQGYERKD